MWVSVTFFWLGVGGCGWVWPSFSWLGMGECGWMWPFFGWVWVSVTSFWLGVGWYDLFLAGCRGIWVGVDEWFITAHWNVHILYWRLNIKYEGKKKNLISLIDNCICNYITYCIPYKEKEPCSHHFNLFFFRNFLEFIRWGTHLCMSLFLSVRPSVRLLCTISQEPHIIWS